MSASLSARSIPKSIALFVITLGLYGIYWTHRMHVELQPLSGEEYNPVVRTIGLFIPLYNLYVMWQDSQTIGRSLPVNQGPGVLFVLWLVVFPVWWFLVQSAMNEQAA